MNRHNLFETRRQLFLKKWICRKKSFSFTTYKNVDGSIIQYSVGKTGVYNWCLQLLKSHFDMGVLL